MANITYTEQDLPSILIEMASYIQDCDEEQKLGYLKELSQSGLFHDAIGKVERISEIDIQVVEEY